MFIGIAFVTDTKCFRKELIWNLKKNNNNNHENYQLKKKENR